MRRAAVLTTALILGAALAACTDNNPAGSPDSGYTDAATGDGGGIVGDPDDPIICVGDPDTHVVCKKASEWWDCEDLPNGDVKCANTSDQTPGGGAEWDCHVEGDKIVCTTDAPDVPGGMGWDCHNDEFGGTTCEKDAPVPPGGGNYDCDFDEEGNWVCEGETAPPTPPPAGGDEICYEVEGDGLPTPPEGYWAKIVASKVLYNGEEALYIRLTLSKAFVDNTYGDWSIGYSGGPGPIGGGHSLGDLIESDKMEIFVDDHKGNLILQMALDYISIDPSAPSGYASLGVDGGEGQMIVGDPSDVLAVQTSLGVNFNGYGYVLTDSSPETDMNWTPNATYPDWIFEVWYESWVKWSAFGGVAPSRVYITELHASPNKLGKKKPIVPIPCPPDL